MMMVIMIMMANATLNPLDVPGTVVKTLYALPR